MMGKVDTPTSPATWLRERSRAVGRDARTTMEMLGDDGTAFGGEYAKDYLSRRSIEVDIVAASAKAPCISRGNEFLRGLKETLQIRRLGR